MRLPARRGQTDDAFDCDSWDDATAAREDSRDEESAHEALVDAVADGSAAMTDEEAADWMEERERRMRPEVYR